MLFNNKCYSKSVYKVFLMENVLNLEWISPNIQYFMRLNFMKPKWKVEIACLFLLNGMKHIRLQERQL